MDFELVSLVLAVLSWNKRSKGVTPPRWWLVTVVTLSVNRGPESSLMVLYCGIPIRVRSVVVVRLLCWEYTLIKLRLLVLVISTNGYNSYFNIGATVWSGADQRNIKALRHCPLWGESPHKGPECTQEQIVNTYLSQVTCCIAASSIDSMYGY